MNAAQQYLVVGLVDEMDINLVPVLLGSGERLFDGVGDDLHGLELVRTVAAPELTHLKLARWYACMFKAVVFDLLVGSEFERMQRGAGC